MATQKNQQTTKTQGTGATPAGKPERRARSARKGQARRDARARLVTFLAAASAAAAVLYYSPALRVPAADAVDLGAAPLVDAAVADPTGLDPLLADSLGVARPTVPVWRQRTDTLARGETLAALLQRAGLAADRAAAALRAVDDARRIPAGMEVVTAGMATDTLADVEEIRFQPAVDRVVTLKYVSGAWQKLEEKLAWRTDTVAVKGAIESSLYDALHGAVGDRLTRAKRSELVWKLADIYEYRVDMSRDLQRGDSVRLVLERSVAPDGSARDAKILAAAISVNGREIQAVRYRSRGAGGDYFDQTGKSLRAAFLRAPVEFRRVSSVFGMRRHPILGRWRMHKGTDYAASSGTPVRTIGDGTVVYAGRKAGYGNVVEVRHFNGYVSRYGHLRGFAKGMRRGASVSIGKTIGYVGMTGLATAPHLHFEVLVGGRQRDPRVALRDKAGMPIPARERDAFAALRSRLFALADGSAQSKVALAD